MRILRRSVFTSLFLCIVAALVALPPYSGARAAEPHIASVAIMRERQGERTELVTTGSPRLNPSVPVTVIIDRDTSSAGEVLAAAFQEHSRGPLVGGRTAGRVGFGAGFALPGGAAILVTIRTVTTGRDVALEKRGATPDVAVDLPTADLDRGIDAQLQRSIQLTVQRVAARDIIAVILR